MRKILLFTSLLFLFTYNLSSAQTSVLIIGTAHEPTSHFNSDTLFEMIIRIKPDVILQELDTALMDDSGNYKGRAINDNGNEHLASMKYKTISPSVIFRGFDVKNRSFYYESHNTFAMENKLSKIIDSLYKHNLLEKYYMQIVSALYSVNQTLNILYDMDIKTLNSRAYMELSAFRQDWLYNKELEVIAKTPQLKEYYNFHKDDGDFWILRNQSMIGNISTYIKQFKGKRIVILTGAMHKYFLTDGLTQLQHKLDFKLEDLPNDL